MVFIYISHYNIKTMINKFILAKGVISLSLLLLFLNPISEIKVIPNIQEINNYSLIEKYVLSMTDKGNLKYFWKNLSYKEQQNFINFKDFSQYEKSKYASLSLSINTIKVIGNNSLSIKFFVKSKDNSIRIPQYYNSHYFMFSVNNHKKLTKVGIFSLKSPIIIYSNRVYSNNIKIPILMLHRVSPSYPIASVYPNAYAYNLDYHLTLTSSDFNSQLKYLKENNYHTIDMNTLYNYYYYQFPLPKNPIILTFDDGRESAFKYAYPLLLKYHDTAVFNIITGFVGSTSKTQKYMNWKQIKTMYDNGMEIESHTVTHLALGDLTVGEMNYQILISKVVLEKKLGESVQFIAYPSGSPFRNNNITKENILISRLKYYGYVAGLIDDSFDRNIQNLANSYALYRIRDSNLALSQFIPLITSNITG